MDGTSAVAQQMTKDEMWKYLEVEVEEEEQLPVMQTPQGQLDNIINDGITTVQQPPLDQKATQQNKEGSKRAAEFIACSNLDSNFTMDHTSKFIRDKKFKSREDLIKWACEVGNSNGFVIVTLRSDNGGKGNKRPRVTLGCERSGTYDSRPPKKEIQSKRSKGRRRTGTKKCDCPFRLKGKQQQLTTDWELMVVNGRHNHEVESSEVGPSFVGGLSPSNEKDGDVRPTENLNKLQKDNERNDDTSSSDSSQCLRELECWRTEMQPLLSKLSEYNFIEKRRTCPETHTILDFFWTHATSLDLLHTFPHVLQVQLTFVGNDYEGASVLIYGLTSTDIQFFVGHVVLFCRRKECYEWAFRTLQGIMVGKGIAMPDVIGFGQGCIDDIYWDVDTVEGEVAALMEAAEVLEDVFIKSKLLFGIFLFGILTKQIDGAEINSCDEFRSFLKKWNILVSSSTTLELKRHLQQLRNDFNMYPKTLKYLANTRLRPYKENFVRTWTNASLHFGTREIETRESTEFECIGDFICDGSLTEQIQHLELSLEKIHAMIELQNTKIKDSFESSLTVVERNEFRYYELNDLRGSVSIKALNLLQQQITMVSDVGVCSCTIRGTHGLPCAHEIAKYKTDGRPIPLDCVHPHWRKLHIEPLRETAESSGVNERMKRQRLSNHMNTFTHSALSTYEVMVESAQRNSTTSGSSIFHSKQGRQLEKVYRLPVKFLGVCPAVMRPYILYIEDVARDGHCGFKAVASLLGNSNVDGWIRVRSDLMNELECHSAQYAKLFMSKERVDVLHHALDYFGTTCLDQKEHWMTMPDMGHIIASCYKVVLMLFSSAQCLTFFPLRTVPLSVSSPKEIAIGFVNEHFVQVFLKQGHPMPLIAEDWYNEQKRSFIEEWITPYDARIQDFIHLQPDIYLDKSPITVDT